MKGYTLHPLLQSCITVIYVIILSFKYCHGQSSINGWSMVDRFSGIRFEIYLKPNVGNIPNNSTIKNQSDIDIDIDIDTMTSTLKQIIVAKADELACFGWVQDSSSGSPTNEKRSLVGEARCSKRMGYMMKRFLQGDDDEDSKLGMTEVKLGQSLVFTKPKERVIGNSKKKNQLRDFREKTVIRDYKDTKIKLHFSHFKILDKRRETCFRDEPHQCEYNDINLL